VKLACQEQLLPGATLPEKWDAAQGYGFDAIELRGQGNHRLRERLPELRAALRAGVPMPVVCVEMAHFIGDFDAERRRDAVANMKTQLSVVAELGGTGAVTPASYGMFSRRLPPFEPPRPPDGDREVLLDGLGTLGEHAAAEGVAILLEPLNRYEDHMVNTVAAAAELADALGLASVQVAADSYHMNIEEADIDASLRAVAPRIGHVQVSDSNRLEPGAGHLDWSGFLGSLAAIGYDGHLSFECRLSGDATEVLPRAAAFLRGKR
jgi:sugar phosphate isomerase/epimerase